MPNFISIFDIHNVVNADGLWQIQIQETYFAMESSCGMAYIFDFRQAACCAIDAGSERCPSFRV
jgi:hypothetical protein